MTTTGIIMALAAPPAIYYGGRWLVAFIAFCLVESQMNDDDWTDAS